MKGQSNLISSEVYVLRLRPRQFVCHGPHFSLLDRRLNSRGRSRTYFAIERDSHRSSISRARAAPASSSNLFRGISSTAGSGIVRLADFLQTCELNRPAIRQRGSRLELLTRSARPTRGGHAERR